MVSKTNRPGRREMAGYPTADMQSGRDYAAPRVPAEVKAKIDAAREQKPAKPRDEGASS